MSDELESEGSEGELSSGSGCGSMTCLCVSVMEFGCIAMGLVVCGC